MPKHDERKSGGGKHPWQHLEGRFQILIAGQKTPLERITSAYAEALNNVTDAVRATGGKIFCSWGLGNPWLAAGEVTQDWFVKMFDGGFEACDPGLPFYPFGYVIFSWSCSDYGRRERRWSDALVGQRQERESSTVCAVEKEELYEQLRRAVDNLPPPLREAIESQYFENLSAAAAAAKYGTTSSIMDQRRFRGRQLLAGHLGWLLDAA